MNGTAGSMPNGSTPLGWTATNTPDVGNDTSSIDCSTGILTASCNGGSFTRMVGSSSFSETLEQTVSGLTMGEAYTITFNQALVLHWGRSTGHFDVTFGTTTLSGPDMSLPTTSPAQTPWQTVSVGPFVATGTSQILRFTPVSNLDGLGSSLPLGACNYTASSESTDLLLDGVSICDIQAPGHVSENLTLWFKADDGISAEGSDVTLWRDQSGNGRDAPQNVAGNRPVLINDRINFNPTLSFNGTSDYLPISGLSYAGTSALSGFTAFVVFQSGFASTSTSDNWAFLDFDRSEYFNFYIQGDGALATSFFANSIVDNASTTAGFNDNAPHIAGALYNPAVVTDTQLFADGVQIYAQDKTAFGTTIGTSNTRFGFIGDGSEASVFNASRNNFHYQGEIAEIILYQTGGLTNSQLNRIQSYLAVKYGITKSGDYLASDGNSIWNAGVNASYHHRITSVARDDQSDLNQRKSTSTNPDAALILNKGGTFLNDKSYIVCGDNNLSLKTTTANTHPSYAYSLERVWKTSVAGNPGVVNVSFIIPNSGVAGDYALLLDDIDSNFSAGALAHTSSVNISGDTITFTGATLNDGTFFTLGSNAKMPSPGNVDANLVLWLKADEGTSRINGDLARWKDRSGLSNDAIQSVAGNRPEYIENVLNFNPGIDFDDVNTEDLEISAPLFQNNVVNDVNVFVILKADQIKASSVIFNSVENRGDRFNIHTPWSNNVLYWDFGNISGAGRIQFGLGQSIVENRLWSFRSSTTKSIQDVRREGAAAATTTVADVFDRGTNSGLFIGSMIETNGVKYNFMDATLSELIIYEGTLTDSERDKIESYLAIKYGVTMLHNYFSTTYTGTNAAATTLYHVNNGYGHDIAGIGREDAESLHQPTSCSINDDAVLTVTGANNLDNGEYLLWGNNNAIGSNTTDLPGGYDERLNRIWFFDETGDVGLVTMRFDLSQLGPRSSNPNDYAILLNNAAPTFAGAVPHTSGATINGNELTFTNVPIADGSFMTLAVSAIGGPGAVSNGMNLWAKASNIRTEVDGFTLDQWTDQSGLSNHLEPILLDRPSLETNGSLNNNPYLNFNTDNLGQATLSSVGNAMTFMAVVKTSNNGSDLFEVHNDLNPKLETTTGFYQMDAALASTSEIGSWNIVGILHGGSPGRQLFVDGTVENSSVTALTIPANQTYNLFRDYTGNLAEMMHYERELSDLERRKVETYLAVKYGITLDISSQDYLNGAGVSVLNRVNFASYSNDIAGIGKANANSGSNAQGLNQMKSKSSNSSAILSVEGGSDLHDGEYLLWGSSNSFPVGNLNEIAPTPTVTGVPKMLNKKWRVTETGETGALTLQFDLNGVAGMAGRETAKFTLVIDDTENMSSPIQKVKPSSYANGVLTFNSINLNEGHFMALGTDVAAAPANVSSGLRLWFKAGANLTTTGDDVTAWADQSGNGFDSQQNSAGNRPTRLMDGINFNPSLAFNGTSDYLPISGLSYTGTGALNGFTTFVVFKTDFSASGNFDNWAFLDFDRSEYFNFYIQGNGALATSFNATSTVDNTSTITGFNDNLPHIGVAIYDASSINDTQMLADGTQIYTQDRTVTGTTIGALNTRFGFIGDGSEASSFGAARNNIYYKGEIAEIIYYETGSLTTIQINAIQSYLALKYGITLPINYFAANGTVTYNVSSFGNDIAGIGREDSQLLLQTRSKSENADGRMTMSSPSHLDDQEFLIWGNDDGALSETTIGVPPGVTEILGRKWRIQETGDVGTVDIKFNSNGITGVGTSVSDFALIIDTDTDFTVGATIITADTFVSDVVSFDGIDLANGTVLGLATGINNALNEISNTVGDFQEINSCPVINGHGNTALRDANHRLVAEINPNGNDLGATCWGVRIRPSGDNNVLVGLNDYFFDRNYFITPTVQPTSAVTVRFYVLTSELNDIRTKLGVDGKSSGNDLNEYLRDFLRITKQQGNDLDPQSTTGVTKTVITPSSTPFGNSGYVLEFDVSGFSEFSLGTNSNNPNQALPVELIDFNGMIERGAVKLKWSTASELNNNGFEVERSWSGEEWKTIAWVPGAGTTNELHTYQYVDPNALTVSTVYYRLKQLDFDGQFEYSKTISVKSQGEAGSLSIDAYPNPSKNGHINVFVNSHDTKVPVDITLYSVTGEVVMQVSGQMNSGSGLFSLGIDNQGMYIVNVQQGGARVMKKIVVD